jgi:hypothetical protein
MTLSTGKWGCDRYYVCSKARKLGIATDCPGRTIREELLDRLVVDYLSAVLFEPMRLRAILKDAIEAEQPAFGRAPWQLDSLLRRKTDLDGRALRMHQR